MSSSISSKQRYLSNFCFATTTTNTIILMCLTLENHSNCSEHVNQFNLIINPLFLVGMIYVHILSFDLSKIVVTVKCASDLSEFTCNSCKMYTLSETYKICKFYATKSNTGYKKEYWVWEVFKNLYSNWDYSTRFHGFTVNIGRFVVNLCLASAKGNTSRESKYPREIICYSEMKG